MEFKATGEYTKAPCLHVFCAPVTLGWKEVNGKTVQCAKCSKCGEFVGPVVVELIGGGGGGGGK